MSWSGGSVSFSGSGGSYSVSYTAPSWTDSPGHTILLSGPTVTSSGPSTVGYSTTASQTYTVSYHNVDTGYDTTSSTTISGTSPSAPTYPPVWSDNTLAAFYANTAYSDGVTASRTPTYSVSSGTLPAGISLNTSTGAVTGTPTGTVGTSYSFTLRATNSDGSTSKAFTGTIQAAPTAGKLKVWNGSAWVYGPVKVWNGTAWVTGTVKVWNGTTWSTSV
jgi:hypothetical protein